ncbi:MAG: TrmH family methyltransferase [Haloplasmataceae bacterium]|jgi:TrmH family RNA methyltransferase|nr:TrmH family methyltransferase [Haloplasmataceae bacterium]
MYSTNVVVKFGGIILIKYKTYKKDFDYSYTLGIFLTIELLNQKPESVIEVLLSSQTQNSTGVAKIIDICHAKNIPFEMNDKMISILSPKENCYAIGIFKKYDCSLDKLKNHIVLVNPGDSGNLGTIIRTALGFDINQLAIIRPGVDIFDPKSVRASMGALFNINFVYFDSFEDYQNNYLNHDIFTFMLNAKIKIHDIKPDLNKPFSLVFGNESSGLDPKFASVGTSVIIPHNQSIDSLNLSIATGIAIYEFTKKSFTV